MQNNLIANHFKLFTNENCVLETYIALGRRVGRGIFQVFELNDALEYFEIKHKWQGDKLIWNNPVLTVKKKVLDLADPQWNLSVMSMKHYLDLEVQERQNLIDNIQNVIDLAQSYFPTYLPYVENAKFVVCRRGFVFEVGVDNCVVGEGQV